MSPDASLLIWINQGWADPGLDFLFHWVSTRLWFSLPLLLGLLFYLRAGYRGDGVRLWLLLMLTVGLGDMLGNLLKAYFALPRPCHDLFELLRPAGGGPPRPCGAATTGMPSNHALNFFAVAAFLGYALRNSRLTLTMFGLAILVAVSRIYLAKHYPSQVLAGALIGVIFGLLMAWLGLRAFAFGARFLSSSGRKPAAPGRAAASAWGLQRLLRPAGPGAADPLSPRSPWTWGPLLASLGALAMVWLNGWNLPVFLGVNRLGTLSGDALWANLTLLGDTLAALVLLGLVMRQRADLLKPMLLTVLLAVLWARGLKPLLELPRPLGMLDPEQVHLIGHALYRHSFPSGHTTTAFALAGLIVLSRVPRALAWMLFVLACLAGLSRAVVGAHWPMDILAGMFGGWLSAALGVQLARAWSWQPGHRAWLGMLLFLVACALGLLITRDLGYPQAIPLQMLIGLLGLVHLLSPWPPAWRRRRDGVSG